MRSICSISLGVLMLATGVSSATTTYDLTVDPSSVTIRGAIFETYDLRAAGSGVLQSFVRISSNNTTEQGYNTSGRPVPFDENTSPTFTHDVQLSDFPIAAIGGVSYYEFILDINQTGSSPLLSLNSMKIFTSTTGGQTTTNISSLGTLRYDMDTGSPGGVGDATVTLNYNNFTGSGQADMVLYVPASSFGPPTDFLYLYSAFGIPNANNDGYEEWSHREPGPPPPPPTVPLPAGAAMGLASLCGLTFMRRRTTH
jgi:hypothetical protein